MSRAANTAIAFFSLSTVFFRAVGSPAWGLDYGVERKRFRIDRAGVGLATNRGSDTLSVRERVSNVKSTYMN